MVKHSVAVDWSTWTIRSCLESCFLDQFSRPFEQVARCSITSWWFMVTVEQKESVAKTSVISRTVQYSGLIAAADGSQEVSFECWR